MCRRNRNSISRNIITKYATCYCNVLDFGGGGCQERGETSVKLICSKKPPLSLTFIVKLIVFFVRPHYIGCHLNFFTGLRYLFAESNRFFSSFFLAFTPCRWRNPSSASNTFSVIWNLSLDSGISLLNRNALHFSRVAFLLLPLVVDEIHRQHQ